MLENPSPRVFTYVVAQDGGFAPNPFYGWCTLACCKPMIRRTAERGDWVLGLSPKRFGSRIVYAMRVDVVLTHGEYWQDPRFRNKRPTWTEDPSVGRCGDNCYEPLSADRFKQHPSDHYDHNLGREDRATKQHDLNGKRALASRHFAYFGARTRELPARLAFAIPGRGHRVRFTPDQLRDLLKFLEHLPLGRHGDPLGFVERGLSIKACKVGPCD